MKFFDPFWKKEFYQKPKPKKFWGAYGRLVLVYSVLGVINACILYTTIFVTIPGMAEKYGKEIKESYPEDLIVEVSDGRMVKNIPGAVRIYPISGELEYLAKRSKVEMKEIFGNRLEYLVVIDDTVGASLSSLKESESAVFFGRDGFIARGERNIRIYPYWSKHPITVTKEAVSHFLDVAVDYSYLLPKFLFIAVVVAYIILVPLLLLFSSIFIAFAVFLVSKHKKVFGESFGYNESFMLVVYALAPVAIIKWVISFIPFVGSIPLLTTVLVFGFLYFMLRKEEGKHTHLMEKI